MAGPATAGRQATRLLCLMEALLLLVLAPMALRPTCGGGRKAAPWGGVQEHYAKPGSFGRPQGRSWEQGMPNLGGYRHGAGLPLLVKEKHGGHLGPPSVLRNHDHGMDNRVPDDAGHDQKIGLKEGVPPRHAQSEADTKRAKQ
jgi:hypothetical protein